MLKVCTSIFLLLLAGLTTCTPAEVAQQETERKPNIIYILADDMGFSDIGCYGGEIRTPNLDRLAANGLRYRQFYNAARCCPTRASLLTGHYPHVAGMGRMVAMPGKLRPEGPYQGYLNQDLPTVAEQLRRAGYRTYMSGKWHVGEEAAHWPLERGFDRYFGLVSGASSYYTIRKDQNRDRIMLLDSNRWEPPAEGWYATTAYSDFAVKRVEEATAADEPFFLYLAYTAPHWPLHAPEETVRSYDGVYAAGWDSLRQARFARQQVNGLADERYVFPETAEDVPAWENAKNPEGWTRKMQVYAAMVEEMDKGIGRLVASLEAKGELDNTLILFLSDNGGSSEMIGGRKLNKPESIVGGRGSYVAYGPPGAFLSNVPFRKYKKWVDEGGIATPLVAHWPKGIAQDARGKWRDDVGHVIDLLPTALAAAGLTVDQDLPGTSLLPSFAEGTAPIERTLFWEHYGQEAARNGRWKLSRNTPQEAWRLFDLQADPAESEDLAARYPERKDSLQQAYQQWAEQVGVDQ